MLLRPMPGITGSDRLVDIVAERIHVAIRIGRLDDSTLVSRKLLPNRRILAASPEYVARPGMPATVAELARHECLVSTANHDGEVWKLHGAGGERAVRPRGRVRSDNGDAVACEGSAELAEVVDGFVDDEAQLRKSPFSWRNQHWAV